MTIFSKSRSLSLVFGAFVSFSGMWMACSSDAPSTTGDGGVALVDSSADGAVDAPILDASITDARADVLVDASPLAVECSGEPCVVQISGGSSQICVRTSTGIAYCWGNNPCGEIAPALTGADAAAPDAAAPDAAQAPFVPGIVPAPRQILSGVHFISVGLGAACAVMDGGALQCWGGLPTISKSAGCNPPLSPTTIDGLPLLESVTATSTVVCGVSLNKEVWCWGASPWLLARATCTDPFCDSSSFPPGRAELGGAKTREVGAFANGVYAVDESGQMQSWGANAVLGRPTQFAYDTPFPVAGMDHVGSVSASTQYFDVRTCAVSNGVIYCWGVDYAGVGPALPWRVALPAGQIATGVSVGAHACATTVDGSVFCWGLNTSGQLGDGSGVDRPIYPVKVQGLKAKATHVVATDVASCALLVSGEVECWGGNVTGELGLGAADHLLHFQPRLVAFK
ncbi:MAG: regulator of chromosome condensation [Myxococcales bacterium]|nr:regulator of chromosome condensation [Myxococcales bacterium]